MIGLLIVAAFVVAFAIVFFTNGLLYKLSTTGTIPIRLFIVGSFIIVGLLGLEAALIQTAIGAIAAKL